MVKREAELIAASDGSGEPFNFDSYSDHQEFKELADRIKVRKRDKKKSSKKKKSTVKKTENSKS